MISYKLLLCFWLLTTLILLYLLSSQKLYSNYNDAPTSNSEAKLNELKNSSNQSTEDNFESRMENLSPAEASKLMRFLEEKNKVIIAKYDSIIKVLIRNEVLSCLKYNAQSPSEIMISEWAWKWINENKDKLKSKL